MIGVGVYDTCTSTVLPWTIQELRDERAALREFYQQFCSGYAQSDHDVCEAKVGTSKESLSGPWYQQSW